MSSPKPFYLPYEQHPPAEPDWHMCKHCGHEIEPGEEGFQLIHGESGRGERSNRPMFLITPRVEVEASVDLHYGCLAEYLIENKTDIVDQILELYLGEDGAPSDEHFCASCDAKLDPNTD